jgi:hypothetical protein
MKRSACFMLLILFLAAGSAVSRAAEITPTVTEPRAGDASAMSDQSMMRDLFDRWERVCSESGRDADPLQQGGQ